MKQQKINLIVIVLFLSIFNSGCSNDSLSKLLKFSSDSDSNSNTTSAGSTTSNDSTSTATSTSVNTSTSFYISSFSPTGGAGTIPTTVQITFNNYLATSAETLSNWSWTCSGGTVSSNTPTNISINGKVATITLPNVTNQTSNTYCTLTASSSIKDTSGNTLSTASATYTITSSSTSADSFYVSSFSPASGAQSAIPTVVQVTFNESLASSAAVISNWSWVCSSGTTASSTPTSISINGNVVTIYLPAVTNQSSNTSCMLTASSSINNTSGDTLTAASATYTISSTSTSTFSVQSFTPASGAQITIPNTVQVIFSKSLAANAATLSNWSWICTSSGIVYSNMPTDVSINGMIATVTLPAVTNQNSSTSCMLTVSSSINDTSGDVLSTTSVTYTVAQSYSYVGYIKSINQNDILIENNDLTVSIFNSVGTTTAPTTIELVVDNVVIYSQAFSSSSFTYDFDTMMFPNGNYTLHVNAYDLNNTKHTDIATPVSFTIANLNSNFNKTCLNDSGTPTLAGSTAVCLVSVSSTDGAAVAAGNATTASLCPTGMKPYGDGNWTITKANTCSGGATWNCGSFHYGTTGYHSAFEDVAPEAVSVPTLLACGPLTSGSVTCRAIITSIGCVSK
ncbi:MAG: Ig-like domain-containing protein [Oligoflexia bacterium]|nr:Ig-like domain-containing protein [Oligoflexia bacterium]